jgi:hypothetical protein
MRRQVTNSRTAALVALAAFVIHQLHFLLSAGTAAGQSLREDGYSYLGHVPVTLGALALTVIVARLLAVYLGAQSPRSGSAGPLLRSPARFAVAVLAIYAVQETLEAVLFSHHAEGILAGLAHGWWLTLLLAVFLGPAFFVLDRWVGRLELLVAAIARPPAFARNSLDARRPSAAPAARPRLSPLAFGLARRPPPSQLATSLICGR